MSYKRQKYIKESKYINTTQSRYNDVHSYQISENNDSYKITYLYTLNIR